MTLRDDIKEICNYIAEKKFQKECTYQLTKHYIENDVIQNEDAI